MILPTRDPRVNVTFTCPNCKQATQVSFDENSQQIACIHCGHTIAIPQEAVLGQQVQRCLVCPSLDLYVRKDFPQRIGIALVAAGIIGSSIAWAYVNVFWTFAILFSSALADLALFAVVGNALMCYRCQAQYRRTEQIDVHGAFNLETHERYRQLAARTGTGELKP